VDTVADDTIVEIVLVLFVESVELAVELRTLFCSFIALFISASMVGAWRLKYVKTFFSMAQRKKLSLPTVVKNGSSPGI
jgi:hypothetical protein